MEGRKLNVIRAGTAVAVFAGLWRAARVGLVAAGLAQPLLVLLATGAGFAAGVRMALMPDHALQASRSVRH